MKRLILIIFCLIPHFLSAQFDLNGTVNLKSYFGFQGQFIDGASNQPAFQKPVIRHVYLVQPDIIALTIDALAPDKTGIRKYFRHPKDCIIVQDGNKVPKHLFELANIDEFVTDEQRKAGSANHFTFIYRNGKKYGWLVGPDKDMFWPIQPMYGQRLEAEWADDLSNYSLSSTNDTNFQPAQSPITVYRKTKPHYKSSIGPGYNAERGERHEIYLKMPYTLKNNHFYQLNFKGEEINTATLSLRFADGHIRSEAIHVNQAGFHPEQQKKAYLSTWMGNGGMVSYDAFKEFHVVDNFTEKIAYKGEIVLIQAGDQPEINTLKTGPLNFHQTHVYELNFSELIEKGSYRIVIPNLGCSFDFSIHENIWQKATKLQMLGFLHQRSGLELGAPETDYNRPRNFHPEDHFTIRETDPEQFFPKEGPERMQHQIFESIKQSIIIDSNNPEAWGGWADAADYDRRFSHFKAVQNMLDLYQYAPEYFAKLKLSLPESENAIPDIVDEALWCTELWRRTQKDNGEITIGVESIAHPKRGEPSWLDVLPVALMPGTPDAAYNYVTTASQMSEVLKQFDTNLSEKYRESSLKAMQWAQENEDQPKFKRFTAAIHEKAAAATALYAMTGMKSWHTLAKKWILKAFPNGFNSVNFFNGRSILIYALLDHENIDQKLQSECRQAIILVAEDLIEGAKETSLGVIRETADTYRPWIIETPNSQLLVVAHQITGEQKFIDALAQSSQFAMGTNPLNLCYTTGLGKRFIYPFHLDSEYGGVAVPSGIPAYGPYILNPNDVPENSWGWDVNDVVQFKSQLFPSNALEWPWFETYFRYIGWPAINEFTIHQGMRDQLLRWGYLAQFYGSK